MKKKIAAALTFWVCYGFILTVFYSGYGSFVRSFYSAVILVVFQATLTYVNLWLWIPLLLKKRYFVIYFLTILFTIVLLIVVRFQIPLPGGLETRRLIGTRARIFFFVFNLILAYSISTAYYFLMEWFRNMQLKAEMKYQQVESELRYLKSQINPHFLFNTLNNIYTLCYLKDDKAAPAVMKLSEMMRYMLHDSNTSFIELEREIEFIRNYLELQQLKKDEAMQISFVSNGIKGKHKIAPLILIAFFENCFKHGDIQTNPYGWIKAEINVDSSDTMQFAISNSKRPGKTEEANYSHVGLKNVRKRLSLLYEGRYELNILAGDASYSVDLTLKLDK